MTWVISRFSPDRHFGFCESLDSPEAKVFFHSRDFQRTAPGEVGPVLGEEVEVPKILQTNRSPFAPQVYRKHPPTILHGEVERYHAKKDWGFLSTNGQLHYFHKRDLLGCWFPLPGVRVEFASGNLKGKLRACWVSVRS